MFSWLEGLVSSIASSIGGVFEGIGDTIVNAIWDNLVKWLFNAFYDSIADVFSQMGDMGAEIFDLSWIESAVHLFFLFGWVLFGVGVIVAAFDLAQIFALCLTAFLQTALLFLGLLTFQDNLLLGLGIMLAAGEVPRIAQQFGLDSSVKVNMMSVVHATSTAVNMTKNIAKSL